MLGEAYWREFRLGIILCQRLLSPVVIGGIVYTCFPQVILNRLATLLQVQLQYFKFFFRHNTITVVVVCTIADAKVQRNYNCYNVYFNECLRLIYPRHLISDDIPVVFAHVIIDALQLLRGNRLQLLCQSPYIPHFMIAFLG